MPIASNDELGNGESVNTMTQLHYPFRPGSTGRIATGLFAVLITLPGAASALGKINMPEGVTEVSGIMYDVHMRMLIMVTVVAIGVFAVLFYSLFTRQKKKGVKPTDLDEHTTMATAWTAIPFVVLVAMAFPATKALLTIEDTSDPDMTIQATGYQWKWKYEYLDDGISFFSNLDAKSNEARQKGSGIDPATVDNYLRDVDNPMVVPINKKIRILTTANDVLHSWWVPELGIKRDAIPGFINESWMRIEKEGIYRGQCAELCGTGHGFMPIVVIAKTEADYQRWVSEQKQAQQAETAMADQELTGEELIARGKKAYMATCAACHMPDGEGSGPFPPLKGSATVKGPVAEHIKTVLNGKGTMMPPFAAQLSDLDIAAIITYERNAWGDGSGDIVQSAQVRAAR